MPESTELSSQPLRPKKLRGLANVSPQRRREISRLGGKAAWKRGVAHRWTSIEASAAGLKSAERRGGAFRAPVEEVAV